MLSYALGEAGSTWIETVRHQEVPFPSVADFGYLGMVPLLAAGLLMVPVAQQSLANRMRSVVDGLMIAASLLLVSWIFVIRPLLAEGSDTVLGLYVVLAYPISDIVLVTVVFYMLAMVRRGAPDSGPLMLIGTAVLVIGATDTVYAYVTLETSLRLRGPARRRLVRRLRAHPARGATPGPRRHEQRQRRYGRSAAVRHPAAVHGGGRLPGGLHRLVRFRRFRRRRSATGAGRC